MTASSSWTAACSPSTSATRRSGPSSTRPAKWDQVTADPDHLAGLNTPYVDEEDEDFDDEYEDYEDEDEDYEADDDDETSGD